MFSELRHFLLIVEHGTFTAAARQAHLSQPALTLSVQRLEEQVGASLFHRSRRGASLTAAGEALVPSARAALAAVDEGRRAVREVLGLERGQVHLAAGGTACTYLLPEALTTFRRAYPGVRLRLSEMTPIEARGALREGRVDLAVITDPEGEPWFVDELVLVGAPDADPAGRTFVSFRPGSSARELLDLTFPEADVVMVLGNIAAVKSHVAMGVGLSLVSRHAVEHDLAAQRLVEIAHPRTPVRRTLSLVHRGLERLSPAAAALRERLQAMAPRR
ncbi:MAG: LysR family transcriptional regulator [Sandaracinaceae bacterium]